MPQDPATLTARLLDLLEERASLHAELEEVLRALEALDPATIPEARAARHTAAGDLLRYARREERYAELHRRGLRPQRRDEITTEHRRRLLAVAPSSLSTEEQRAERRAARNAADQARRRARMTPEEREVERVRIADAVRAHRARYKAGNPTRGGSL